MQAVALGTQVVRQLVADRREVIGFARTAAHGEVVQQLGASRSITGDVLTPASIRAALESTRPGAVVHALTAISKRGPWHASDLKRTNELQIRGTHHLLDAALSAGARRIVVESTVFIYGYGDLGPGWLSEDTSPAKSVPKDWLRPSIDALVDMETQVIESTRQGRIEGIVLRFGDSMAPGREPKWQ